MIVFIIRIFTYIPVTGTGSRRHAIRLTQRIFTYRFNMLVLTHQRSLKDSMVEMNSIETSLRNAIQHIPCPKKKQLGSESAPNPPKDPTRKAIENVSPVSAENQSVFPPLARPDGAPRG